MIAASFGPSLAPTKLSIAPPPEGGRADPASTLPDRLAADTSREAVARVGAGTPRGRPAPARSATELLAELVGEYEGQWQSFRWDFEGEAAAPLTRWTDHVTASDPVVEEGRAYVLVIDSMTFEDGSVQGTAFTEGYFLRKDGTPGVRYFETAAGMGEPARIHEEHPFGPNTWVFTAEATRVELAMMGFGPSLAPQGSHVTFKRISHEGGVRTEHVSRISTVSYQDASGHRRTVVFKSLEGSHRRAR